MADGEINFAVDTTNGPVSATTYPRDEFIDTLKYLKQTDTALRALDDIDTGAGTISSYGMWAFDSNGTCQQRTISGSDGLAVTNGNGVSGKPTIGIDDGWTALQKILSTPEELTSGGQTVSVEAPLTILKSFTSPATCVVPLAPTGEVNLKILMNNTGVSITCNESSGSLDGSAITLPDKGLAILVSNEAQIWNRLV